VLKLRIKKERSYCVLKQQQPWLKESDSRFTHWKFAFQLRLPGASMCARQPRNDCVIALYSHGARLKHNRVEWLREWRVGIDLSNGTDFRMEIIWGRREEVAVGDIAPFAVGEALPLHAAR
jgi:hypothetical protein